MPKNVGMKPVENVTPTPCSAVNDGMLVQEDQTTVALPEWSAELDSPWVPNMLAGDDWDEEEDELFDDDEEDEFFPDDEDDDDDWEDDDDEDEEEEEAGEEE